MTRYRCIKKCIFELCNDDGFFIENEYRFVEPGSIWEESEYLIAGGPGNIHLDRVDGEEEEWEWCEPLRENIGEYFEKNRKLIEEK